MKITEQRLRAIIRQEISTPLSEGVIEDGLINQIVSAYRALPDTSPYKGMKIVLKPQTLDLYLKNAARKINLRTMYIVARRAALFGHAARLGLLGKTAVAMASSGYFAALAAGSAVAGSFLVFPMMMVDSVDNLNTVEGGLRNMSRIQRRPLKTTDLATSRGTDAISLAAEKMGVQVPDNYRQAVIDTLAMQMIERNMGITQENLSQRLFNDGIIGEQFMKAVNSRMYKLRGEEIPKRLRKKFFESTLDAFKKQDQDAIYATVRVLAFLV